VKDSSLWPKERRNKSTAVNGKLDNIELLRTPNGSFWDPDDEYFNRNGFDIHGGYYLHDLEYIPGPNWLSDLGCYEDEKEKYQNIDLEKLDDNLFFGAEEAGEDDPEFQGDFEGEDDDFNDEEYQKYLNNENFQDILKNLNINDKNIKENPSIDEILKSLETVNLTGNKPTKIKGKKNKKKKKATKKNEDEEWETASDN